MTIPNNISTLVQELACEPFVIFAGAGISYPSGLPIAAELTTTVLDLLPLSNSDRDALRLAKLPFEAFIETLSQICDVSHLYEIYRQGIPNANHHLCVQLCARGYSPVVVTTNFDLLFENAFEFASIHAEKYWRNDELAMIGWNGHAPKIIKVHGSIEDERSLAITIRQVAGQKHLEGRTALIEQVFGSKVCNSALVLGYSCSDKFDINPVLRRISGERTKVILVMHNTSKTSEAKIEILGRSTLAGPFSSFPGFLVECDTRLFVNEIYRRILKQPLPEESLPGWDWRSMVSEWFGSALNKHGTAFSFYAAGRLLKAASMPQKSIAYLEHALKAHPSPSLLINILQGIGDNHRDLGNLEDAQRNLRRVLRRVRHASMTKEHARALLSWGVVKADLKKYELSIRYYRKAEQLARQCDDPDLEAISIGNAGIALKNLGGTKRFKKAIRNHMRALEIARESGDKRSEGRTLGNLGITYSRTGDIPTAMKYYEMARSIAENLGDDYHTAIWLANEGEDCMAINYTRAITLLSDAIRIFSNIGSEQWVEYCRQLLDEHLKNNSKYQHE